MRKAIFFLLSLIYTTLMANAQTTTQEALPDSSLISDMAKLNSATVADTTLSNLAVSPRGQHINFGLYNLTKKYKNAAGFSGQKAVQVKEIIALSNEEKKILDLINNLRVQAIYLCKNNFHFSDQIEPQQQKIGYSWGSKDFTLRQKPPGLGDCCEYKIHGLDCSGFIYQLFYRNNIKVPVERCNAETERQPTFLKKYLGNLLGDSFEVVNLGKLKFSEMHTGDIIYFYGDNGVAYHIGIVLVNENGNIALFQSIGNPDRKNSKLNWCEKNITPDYGVVAKIINSTIEVRTYACVRIRAK